MTEGVKTKKKMHTYRNLTLTMGMELTIRIQLWVRMTSLDLCEGLIHQTYFCQRTFFPADNLLKILLTDDLRRFPLIDVLTMTSWPIPLIFFSLPTSFRESCLLISFRQFCLPMILRRPLDHVLQIFFLLKTFRDYCLPRPSETSTYRRSYDDSLSTSSFFILRSGQTPKFSANLRPSQISANWRPYDDLLATTSRFFFFSRHPSEDSA